MAYNQELADRVRCLLGSQPEVVEKRMLGGLSFMVKNKMCCGVLKDDLVIRIGLDRYEEALAKPSVRPMDFTGRPLKGFLYVGPEGYRTDEGLKAWVDEALSFASSLPAGRPRRGTRKGQ